MKRLWFERGIRRFLVEKKVDVNEPMYLTCGNGLNELNSGRHQVWVPEFA